MSSFADPTLIDDLRGFLKDYYAEEIATLAQKYPHTERSLTIDWSDLYTAMPDFADDIRDKPHGGDTQRDPLGELHEALYTYDLPVDVSLESDKHPDAHVRIRMPDHTRLGLSELRSRHRGTYVAIRGQIERVTEADEQIKTAVFTCNKCGTDTKVPQPRDTLQEPNACQSSCSGKPNFRLNDDKSETVDFRKLKLTQPPEDTEGSGSKLTVVLSDDLAFNDGDRSLMGMGGERVTVHGILKRDKSETRGRNGKPIFRSFLQAHELEFEGSILDDIDVDAHKDEINRLIDQPGTFDKLAQSVAPSIKGDVRMESIKRGIVLFLFGAARKEEEGGSLRGDIHMILVGDPSTGKTQLLDFIEAVSPRSERLSGTEGTGAGLTATAEQDEFAGGNWVLTPGLLPLASGGHAIVDEIDKMNDGVDKLHEALESQRVNVAKAGKRATLKTEAGAMMAANPEKGRFTEHSDIVKEIELPPALFSRFDIIHTLRDRPDPDVDSAVATAGFDRWQSSAMDGETTTDDAPVGIETFRAWIALAQEYEPVMTDAAKERLKEWYVKERNGDDDSQRDESDPIPLTPRAIPSTARMAEAHARVHLRDKITVEDAEEAIRRKGAVMHDVYMNENGNPDRDHITQYGKQARVDTVRDIIESMQGREEPAPVETVLDEAESEGIARNKAEHEIDKLKQKGELYEPKTGSVRTT